MSALYRGIHRSAEQEVEVLGDAQSQISGPPDDSSNVAVISGISLSNLVGFQPGDLTPYFNFGPEEAFVWTHTEHEFSKILTKIEPNFATKSIPWKTLGSCLELATTLGGLCEFIGDYSYHWICDFDPSITLEEQQFYGYRKSENGWVSADIRSGAVHDLLYLADLSRSLELLQRDDRFFKAAQFMLASFRSHWCCLACELGGDSLMHHPSHEPEAWQAIQLYPQLDIGILQACRAAEAVLGQIGKNEERAERRCREAIGLDPRGEFLRSHIAYLEYFRGMYLHRNDAAHSQGKLSFAATRRNVIDAQCFAFLVLDSYFLKHAISMEEAKARLEFNGELLSEEIRGPTTKMTYSREEAARQRTGLREIYGSSDDPG